MRADPPVIFWFRQDLRLADNPGLTAAIATGRPVLPVYILDDEALGPWRPGGASRWWLHHSLVSLGKDLSRLAGHADSRRVLVLRREDTETALRSLIDQTGATAVYWTRRYEPDAIAVDARIMAALIRDGIEMRSFAGSLLFEPWTIATGQGTPYRVFTPYYRACMAQSPGSALPLPSRLVTPDARLESLPISGLDLLPMPDWAEGMRSAWVPGESGARAHLDHFLNDGIATYREDRDHPHLFGTSRLSPHLHFGEISPRVVWQAAQFHRESAVASTGAEAYLRQLIWREFSHHLLYHFPDLPSRPLRPGFDALMRLDAPDAVAAWRRGRTGYPIVDAGMRELWATGWMHNRVRMIVASFLVKDLLQPWQIGAAWFWDTLVDADLANNAASWQWVAGCGADAAPFFRIFNPVLQGSRFDPGGDYVRRWVPELAGLGADHIHAPWEAPAPVLDKAGVRLGRDYPLPIVDHAMARRRALDAFRDIGTAKTSP